MAEDHGGAGSLGVAEGALPLDRAHSQAYRALLMVRDGLERLERLEIGVQLPSSTSPSYREIGGGQDAQGQQALIAPDLLEHLRLEIGQLQAASADMNRMLQNQVLAKAHWDLWNRRIEQIADEMESFKAGLDQYLLRHRRRQHRAEFFRRNRRDGADILEVHDDEMKTLQSLKNSSRMSDGAYATVLAKLPVQLDRLNSAEREAYDMLTTVAINNRRRCLIERRRKGDPWMAFAGMVFTRIILIVVINWLP